MSILETERRSSRLQEKHFVDRAISPAVKGAPTIPIGEECALALVTIISLTLTGFSLGVTDWVAPADTQREREDGR